MSGSDAIPAELRVLPQWLVWRSEMRDGKNTKVPYQPGAPDRRASSTDPKTWGTYDDALNAASSADGIGFVFTESDPFAGVDLDNCVAGGSVHPHVVELVSRLDSYTEFSPSGRGLHVLVRASVNGGRKRTTDTPWGSEFENYNRGRFFCVTGDHLDGTPCTVEERQEQLDEIRAELLPEAKTTDPKRQAHAPATDDVELLRRARNAKNGAGFDQLWRGDTSAYDDDDSRADLALCGILAFWTGPDPRRVDSLFRQSGLMREKWDAHRGESTYGAQTIAKALQGRTEFYADRGPAAAGQDAAAKPTGDDGYHVTFTDAKPPKLVFPTVPAIDDTAGHCGWLIAALNLNPAHPITSGQHEGLRGAAGHVVLNRRGAPPIRFEPAARINNPARIIEDVSWQAIPTDGAVYPLKAEHCRQIAHVVRMLCGANKAISDEEETAGLVMAFLAGAMAHEGFTVYGTPEQRYEAAAALQREIDEQTGRPCGPARYLIDANTGEYVMRVQDLGESVRRQLGSGLPRGFLDGRMDGLGWTRSRLDGHALPGRSGRAGPHARCHVYRGVLSTGEDDGSVTT